jgi:hypothetical protein
MRKSMFWPGLVTVLSLSILAIWFHHNSVEFKLRQDALEELSDDHAWADIRLNGRDLSLYGVSPSEDAQKEAVDRLYDVDGVRVVIDQSSLLPIADPFVTSIVLSAGEIKMSGSLSTSDDRSYLIKLLSQTIPAVSIIDETELARGASQGYVVLIEETLKNVSQYSTWGIEIVDGELTITLPEQNG